MPWYDINHSDINKKIRVYLRKNMIFSKSCEYGLRAVLYICLKSKNKENIGVKEIAKEIKSPVAFTAKILQSLAKQKIILSLKGPNGGFYINNDKKNQITILQVVEAIEGKDYFDKCVIGLENCSEKKPCPIHAYFITHKKNLKELFSSKTIYDIIENQNGKINLK